MNNNCIKQQGKPDGAKMVFKMLMVLNVLLLAVILSANATTISRETYISIRLNNVSIKQVVSEIEKKSDFIFLIPGNLNDEMSKKIDINVKNESIEEILNIITYGNNFNYKIYDKQIVFYLDEEKEEIVFEKPIHQKKEARKNSFNINGTIIDSNDGETIIFAVVEIKELNLWATSDKNGEFSIQNVLPGEYTLEVSSMGYVTYSIPISVSKNIPRLNILLEPSNLLLDDVIVTAQSGGAINSSHIMEKASIDHLQPSSLADVMQLMPGAITNNPNLTTQNTINIRNIKDYKGLNASGVGLLIDGNKISNNAEVGTATFDYRKIPTDNIESVEVMTGVLSAQYGDMTSGAIVVKTKAGMTPYEVRIKSDPRTKAASINKGYRLPSNVGFLNVSMDYARAFKKNISPVDIFDRTTVGLTYSNTFNKEKTPFRFNFKVNGNFTSNNVTQDPDVSKEDFSKSSTNNLNTSIYGSWMLNKPYISVLNYNISAVYQKQTTNQYTVINRTPTPTTNTKVPGIAEGSFTELLYKEDYWLESVPLSFNAKIHGNLNKLMGKTLFSSLLGFEYNHDGNKGRGSYYTDATPPFFRERNYKEIPFMNNISLFAEEKIKIPIKRSTLELVGGARITKMKLEGYNYNPTVEPRFNARYELFKPKHRGALRKLNLRGGWGIMEKLPSIGYLYPEPIYMDYNLFRYTSTEANKSLAIIHTDIIDELLPYNLKPNKTYNMEMGIDLNISGINAQITYFKEKLVDGITPNVNFKTNTIKYYDAVTGENADPKFENGTVYTKDDTGNYIEVPYTLRNDFKLFGRPDNRGKIDKWGIEYSMSFPKIETLNTTVILNGAYLKTQDSKDGEELKKINSNDPVNPQEVFPYLAVFDKNTGSNIGNSAKRFNTNLNFVTNIPAIRMIVSLTTQFIWFSQSRYIFDPANSYIEDQNGKPIYDDFSNKNVMQDIYRDPTYYIGFDGNRHPFSDFHTTNDPVLKTRLALLRETTNHSYYFLPTGYKPYMMANIRLTKEIGDNTSLSFYANNFTNYTPIKKDKARPNAIGTRLNSEIYFGAEVKFKF
ncbi:MAG: carboxypeptidase-like regulatory domain-containing protein [Proteiniphilum sp.]|nr:carboxypeptidase-like regulatory domain-containing protein [Proteiniphilum sp.]MDD3908473.1 carboxypeptidase-like regulatory domain-containing protein [Proteiniphilum sp.]MDD4415962.1 carboxypeptidase-like regulatory domain-containing protein [Proteiniphilum sp.]